MFGSGWLANRTTNGKGWDWTLTGGFLTTCGSRPSKAIDLDDSAQSHQGFDVNDLEFCDHQTIPNCCSLKCVSKLTSLKTIGFSVKSIDVHHHLNISAFPLWPVHFHKADLAQLAKNTKVLDHNMNKVGHHTTPRAPPGIDLVWFEWFGLCMGISFLHLHGTEMPGSRLLCCSGIRLKEVAI